MTTVAGDEKGGSYQYDVFDGGTLHDYKVCYVSEGEEKRVESNIVSFVNMIKVGKNISEDTVWGENAKYYYIDEIVTIEEGVTLRISRGTNVEIVGEGELYVQGTLLIEGEQEDEVIVNIFDKSPLIALRGMITIAEGAVMTAEYVQINSTESDMMFCIYVLGDVVLDECCIEATRIEESAKEYYDYVVVGVEKSGNLIIRNSNIIAKKRKVLHIESNEDKVEVYNCNMESDEEVFYFYPQGNVEFFMCGNRIVGGKKSDLVTRKECSIRFENNVISGGEYNLEIHGIRSKAFVFAENEFVGDGLFPIKVDNFEPEEWHIEEGYLEQLMEQNFYSGYSEYNGVILGVVIRGDVELPVGEYALSYLSLKYRSSLSVNAGTRLHFIDEGVITVDGKLELNGTEENPILISGMVKGEDEECGVSEYGNMGRLHVYDSGKLNAQYVRFINLRRTGKNEYPGVYIQGIAEISDCEFYNIGGITIDHSGVKATLKRCRIEMNEVLTLGGGGEYSNVIIEDSTICSISNYRQVIDVTCTGKGTVSIRGNEITGVCYINSNGNSNLFFEENTIAGTCQVKSLGSGELRFAENIFDTNTIIEYKHYCNCPIIIDINYISDNCISEIFYKNSFSGDGQTKPCLRASPLHIPL